MRVIAKAKGFYNSRMQNPGDVFTLKEGDEIPAWAKEFDGKHVSPEAEEEDPVVAEYRRVEDSTIMEAVAKLDPAVDKNWTKDGKPDLKVIRDMTGMPNLTRDQVDAASDGYRRDS